MRTYHDDVVRPLLVVAAKQKQAGIILGGQKLNASFVIEWVQVVFPAKHLAVRILHAVLFITHSTLTREAGNIRALVMMHAKASACVKMISV
jgi:hypothetical protein